MNLESDKRIMEVVQKLYNLLPIKISFNGIILYNDYDDIGDGECETLIKTLPNRLYHIDDYIVTSIKIEIVQFHHSVVELFGVYSPKERND